MSAQGKGGTNIPTCACYGNRAARAWSTGYPVVAHRAPLKPSRGSRCRTT